MPTAQIERALLRLVFRAGSVVSLSPVLGLAVFWWLPFKPAVTFHVLITGLAIVLLKFIELSRLSSELDEIVTSKMSHMSRKEKKSRGAAWLL